jgi:hypothetical protein
LGTDVSYYLQRLSVEAEWIHVYLDEPREVNLDLAFYYVNLGYRVTERLYAYVGYWTTEERVRLGQYRENVSIRTPVAGLAYSIEDQITFKIQHAHVDVDVDFNDVVAALDVTQTNTFEYFTLAVSIAF